jgi:phosphoglycolate phosphatase-like HAD superfamily hydrolase
MRMLITDLDNTLYDWVTFFAKAFQRMLDELSSLIDVDEQVLVGEFRTLHRVYGSSEQPFTILDLPAVRKHFGDLRRRELKCLLDGPLHAFNSVRKQHLRLYGSVAETLSMLRSRGVLVVGHTESMAVNAYFRLQWLKIDQYFRRLYALESDYPGHPDPERSAALQLPADLVRVLPRHERKPNPALLRDICRQEGVSIEDTWYVGDSIARDISMAKAAGITAIWARYGTLYDRDSWRLLVSISHWSEEEVRAEEALKLRTRHVEPDYVIDDFKQLLTASFTAIDAN